MTCSGSALTATGSFDRLAEPASRRCGSVPVCRIRRATSGGGLLDTGGVIRFTSAKY